jgi:hypothetical protein
MAQHGANVSRNSVSKRVFVVRGGLGHLFSAPMRPHDGPICFGRGGIWWRLWISRSGIPENSGRVIFVHKLWASSDSNAASGSGIPRPGFRKIPAG